MGSVIKNKSVGGFQRDISNLRYPMPLTQQTLMSPSNGENENSSQVAYEDLRMNSSTS